jgi:hypothetical protein
MKRCNLFEWALIKNFSFYFLFHNEMIDGFLYLLQRYDHRKHHQEISKNGCKNDFNMIINKYHFDTQIITVCPIDNEKKCEGKLIPKFKSEFDFRSDIWNECFDGNEREMISAFNDYCSDHLS